MACERSSGVMMDWMKNHETHCWEGPGEHLTRRMAVRHRAKEDTAFFVREGCFPPAGMREDHRRDSGATGSTDAPVVLWGIHRTEPSPRSTGFVRSPVDREEAQKGGHQGQFRLRVRYLRAGRDVRRARVSPGGLQ